MLAHLWQRLGGGRVAGEDEHRVLREQPVHSRVNRRTSSAGAARTGSGVVAEIDGGLAGEPALDLGQDGETADSESKTAIGRWSGETTAAVSGRPRPRPVCGGARGGRRRCCGRPSRSGRRAGRDERHALVVRGQDQPSVGHDLEVDVLAEHLLHLSRLMPPEASARFRMTASLVGG